MLPIRLECAGFSIISLMKINKYDSTIDNRIDGVKKVWFTMRANRENTGRLSSKDGKSYDTQ